MLTRRIAHLIATRDAAPWQVLAITFTNKAADEMRRRVAELSAPGRADVGIDLPLGGCADPPGHGDRLGYKGSFTIYDDADSRRWEIVCRELDVDTSACRPVPSSARSARPSRASRAPPSSAPPASTIFDRRIADVFEVYQQRMVAANAMDFDDLLLNTVRLFRDTPMCSSTTGSASVTS